MLLSGIEILTCDPPEIILMFQGSWFCSFWLNEITWNSYFLRFINAFPDLAASGGAQEMCGGLFECTPDSHFF